MTMCKYAVYLDGKRFPHFDVNESVAEDLVGFPFPKPVPVGFSFVSEKRGIRVEKIGPIPKKG